MRQAARILVYALLLALIGETCLLLSLSGSVAASFTEVSLPSRRSSPAVSIPVFAPAEEPASETAAAPAEAGGFKRNEVAAICDLMEKGYVETSFWVLDNYRNMGAPMTLSDEIVDLLGITPSERARIEAAATRAAQEMDEIVRWDTAEPGINEDGDFELNWTPPKEAGAEARQRFTSELAASLDPERVQAFLKLTSGSWGSGLRDFGEDSARLTIHQNADGTINTRYQFDAEDDEAREVEHTNLDLAEFYLQVLRFQPGTIQSLPLAILTRLKAEKLLE